MSPRQPPLAFPLQNRHRAVAELDALIEQAERTCADCRGEAERTEAVGNKGRAARGRLQMAEKRLAGLLRSRRVLTEGDERS